MILIKNAKIVSEGEIFSGEILIKNEKIESIWRGKAPDIVDKHKVIDLSGKYILPGIIDDQVHFRDPGLSQKADLHTESIAAAAGGVTSFLEMPNTNPQTTTQAALIDKLALGAKKSVVNYGFYFGATNENSKEIINVDTSLTCGIKVFMGASTGNMLVDNEKILAQIFKESPLLIATHCEDETTIRNNMAKYKTKYGEDMPIKYHPEIRSRKACTLSSKLAIELAKEYNSDLHVLHLSTADETKFFTNEVPLENKKITAEVCVHHLWFNNSDYEKKGTLIKWNPAIKTENDRKTLFEAMLDDRLDIIATDHAPHTIQEKQNNYWSAPSGAPMVQHSLQVMLEFYQQGEISLTKIVQKMAHNPAIRFKIKKRGFIKEGYYADFTIIDINNSETVNKENILYKCGWSPLEGTKFSSSIFMTIVNGHIVYQNKQVDTQYRGKMLKYNRKN